MQHKFRYFLSLSLVALLISINLPALEKAGANSSSELAKGISGLYQVEGINPDGSSYRGTCTIEFKEKSGYLLSWKIAKDTFSGKGVLMGNTLTVDWGQADPVIYTVLENGKRLEGTWKIDGGEGNEILTR